jgi:hypothetical protein
MTVGVDCYIDGIDKYCEQKVLTNFDVFLVLTITILWVTTIAYLMIKDHEILAGLVLVMPFILMLIFGV